MNMPLCIFEFIVCTSLGMPGTYLCWHACVWYVLVKVCVELLSSAGMRVFGKYLFLCMPGSVNFGKIIHTPESIHLAESIKVYTWQLHLMPHDSSEDAASRDITWSAHLANIGFFNAGSWPQKTIFIAKSYHSFDILTQIQRQRWGRWKLMFFLGAGGGF